MMFHGLYIYNYEEHPSMSDPHNYIEKKYYYIDIIGKVMVIYMGNVRS